MVYYALSCGLMQLLINLGPNTLENKYPYNTINPIYFLESSWDTLQRLQLTNFGADWLELPAALVLLIVVAPSLFSSTLRSSLVGVIICLAIACYLLQQHVRASGGFRNSFTKAHGISNTVGIILLLVYPAWALLLEIL
ncbi:hypothetical protein Goklo_003222 [Gossypium klotzschianum]|uniref:Uncharacterized protein n=1 Tax=Gossypium klotzschianum TaxID=34286 RepID=A0A7J8VWB3_9ROSI|nr:hypothetical protein [Gossypium klotzschianum]